jgi:hypothetical protein
VETIVALHTFSMTHNHTDGYLQVSTIILQGNENKFHHCFMMSAYDRVNIMARKKQQPDDTPSEYANRLVIPLSGENEIDWESVRDSQREQLLSTINNDVTILEHIGMSQESAGITENGEEVLPELTMENVGTGLDILSQANALVFRMLVPMVFPPNPWKSMQAGKRVPMSVDKDIALTCFRFSKEQHAELDPRALRLAKKYMPDVAKKNLDIWLLASMFLKYSIDNASKAVTIQLARDHARVGQQNQQVSPTPAPDSDNRVVTQPTNGVDHSNDFPAQPTNEEEQGGESLEPGAEPEPGV